MNKNSKCKNLETLVLVNLSSTLRKTDEEERVGDIVFFGEVLKNIPKSAKEALVDPDWHEAMKNKFD